MAVGPIGGMIYANQNMHLQATKQLDFQSRLEAQNSAAAAAVNEKEKEVQEVRPAEETYKIDPEKEHEQEKSDQEAGAKPKNPHKKDRKEENKEISTHILDITI
ncbi:MAG: hypothetical protein M0P02_06425 [Sulfurospirillaceae bacterium]|jgi:hypothetical protein|nr:hypothetical protein [Sulfurospirillaceae bacterium]MCK9545735.1 hypothetical protein [Sulfurospirillaceae bacterium]NLM99293.1 hypothetical protein [Campylobacteraceae bacterium]